MTLPLDCTPLAEAIVAAMTGATGQPRSLGAQSDPVYFVEAPPHAKLNVADVKASPAFQLTITNATGDPAGQPMEGGDRMRELRVVTIRCTWWADSPTLRTPHAAIRARVERESQRVKWALIEAGALALSPSGADTGADDGCLRWDSYASAGPEWPKPGEPALVTVTHVFRTTVELRKPST